MAAVPHGRPYPRTHQSAGKAASEWLRIVLAAFFDRLERYLAVRDRITEQESHLLAAICAQAEHRVLARLRKVPPKFDVCDLDSPDLVILAAARADGRVVRHAARRTAVALFGTLQRLPSTEPMPWRLMRCSSRRSAWNGPAGSGCSLEPSSTKRSATTQLVVA